MNSYWLLNTICVFEPEKKPNTIELNNKEITGHPGIISSLWFSTPPIERADNEATKTPLSQLYTQGH